MKLEDINFNIEKVNGLYKMIGESEILQLHFLILKKRKGNLLMNLEQLKKFKKKKELKHNT
jgi:hypothetical protein